MAKPLKSWLVPSFSQHNLRLVVSGCCLHISVTKFWDKFASLRQVNSPSSWDKFQKCCADMYLIRFILNFLVFCVFLWISRIYLNFAALRLCEISEALTNGILLQYTQSCSDCSIDLCILWDACHELFYVFGDSYASGMQDVEETKSLIQYGKTTL